MKLNVFLSPVIVDELYFTGKTTVVIDVLRATSTIVTAISNGAKEVVPMASVEFAVKVSGGMFGGQILLGGERNTKKIEGFALGNSPFEYSRDIVEGKTIVFYTTNGTRSIAKAKYSENLYTCSFLNISAIAKHLITLNTDVEIVCSGRNNYFSIEDSVCAGMLISKISKVKEDSFLNDSGAAVLTVYEKYGANLMKMMRESDHGKILLENGFEADLEYCSSIDILDDIPSYSSGVLKKLKNN
jgi:2-phosphosulfolactate phosphatase